MRLYLMLGLEAEKTSNSNNDKLEAVVNMLIGMRNQRADKNFKLSDQIRDQLIAYGIQLKDGKEGTLVFNDLFSDQLRNSNAKYLKYDFKILIFPL
jgi:cysteinyl-tRNA synthetase